MLSLYINVLYDRCIHIYIYIQMYRYSSSADSRFISLDPSTLGAEEDFFCHLRSKNPRKCWILVVLLLQTTLISDRDLQIQAPEFAMILSIIHIMSQRGSELCICLHLLDMEKYVYIYLYQTGSAWPWPWPLV